MLVSNNKKYIENVSNAITTIFRKTILFQI